MYNPSLLFTCSVSLFSFFVLCWKKEQFRFKPYSGADIVFLIVNLQEQRKIYDSADASMNTFRKPIAGQTNKPSSIGQRMAARGQQQAAEHGSLKSRQRAPPVKADISKQAIPVPTKTEKRDENVQPTVDTGAKTSESEQLAQTASTQAASSFNKINISLGARSKCPSSLHLPLASCKLLTPDVCFSLL